MSLAPGVRLGVYEVLGLIGTGGMGAVYRARDTRLNREVALKVLPDLFAHDSDRLARFQREAQVLASLNHPNIAAIYGLEESPSTLRGPQGRPEPSRGTTGSGQAGNVRALVLELVEGPTLADRIARGPVPLDEALPVARQIAEALEAAHEHGIIHRDLKPANVKVRPDGTAKVLDFGLAKAMGDAPTGASLTQSPTLSMAATRAGVILGTAAYMAPEQAKGRATDKRSDVWAFGCVLYEMLTGRPTFEGADVSEVLAGVIKSEPDWNRLPPDTPAYIRTLLRRCLQKDPQRRLPHIGVARLEIDEGPVEAVEADAAATRREPALAQVVVQPWPLWKRSAPLVAGAIVVSALTSLSWWSFGPSMPPVTIARSRFILPSGQQFTNAGRRLVAISPDGTQMVYVANQRLYLRSMSELEARPIPGTENSQENVTLPAFSPDGRSIAFATLVTGRSLRINRIAVSGGPVVTIGQGDFPNDMSWGTSGIVFDQGPKGIMRVPGNGGTPELLVSVGSDEVAAFPQMLPGDQAVLFTVATGRLNRWDKAHIVVQSLGSGERKTLVESGSNARYALSGHIVYARGGTLYAAPFDVRRLEITGEAAPVVEGVRPSANAGTAHFSVSDTGSLVFVPGSASTENLRELVLMDRNGGVEPLKLQPGEYEAPRMSPNGRQVAFSTDDGKEAIVWIYDLSGASAPRRLTFSGQNRFPVWSADGQRIAFQSDRDGDLGIYWQRADGADTAERLTKADQGTSHIPESWSPKGDRLSFSLITASSASLWMLSLQDKKAAPFRESQLSLPLNSRFSPDGRWIAYTFREPGTMNVLVEPFPATGARYQISKDVDSRRPIWSPDGKAIFYNTSGEDLVVVPVSTQPNFTVGNPEPLSVPRASANAAVPGNHDITPDGKRFIVAAPASGPEADAPSEIHVVHNWFEELKRLVPTR